VSLTQLYQKDKRALPGETESRKIFPISYRPLCLSLSLSTFLRDYILEIRAGHVDIRELRSVHTVLGMTKGAAHLSTREVGVKYDTESQTV
jgi:hypothetical protein